MERPAKHFVTIGASAGGMDAIASFLGKLGDSFEFPVLITKHLAEGDEFGLIDILNKSSKVSVELVDDKQKIESGHVYLAPGGYHLQVEEEGLMSLSADERVAHSRPSIDVLFQTAADVYGRSVIAVILTGANRDGAAGIRAVHKKGGVTIAQNPDSAEVHIMPKEAISTGCVDHVLELDEIAPFVLNLTETQ